MERLGTALFLLAGLCASNASAGELVCGEYVHRDGEFSQTLVIEGAEQARMPLTDSAPIRYLYRVEGKRLHLYDLADGGVEAYRLDRARRRIRSDDQDRDYQLERPAECKASTLPPPGTCRTDLAECFAGHDAADALARQRYCEEGVAFSCMSLIEDMQQRANGVGRTRIPEEAPPECREGEPSFNEATCKATATRLLTQALGEAFASIGAEDRPLPPADLDRTAQLCRSSRAANVCNAAAQVLWTGGRLLDARTALQLACEGGDPNACGSVRDLAGLTQSDEKFPATKALPCGRYVAQGALVQELAFGDKGLVEREFGNPLRARLEGGGIRIRHDKGGDFVFRPIAGDRLLGMDESNRFAVYQRMGGPNHCAAPVVYREVPLRLDCPLLTGETAPSCCARGNLHGCNAAGSALALADDWSAALPFYAKVCAGGVRVGCENLVQVYARGGDENALEALARICATDERHVACDVQATSNWQVLGLSHALQEIAEDMVDLDEAERPDSEDEDGR